MMRDYRANDFICIASVTMELLDKGRPRPEDYPDLHAGYWAAACPERVWDEAGPAFGIHNITTGYGMTECGATSVMTRPGDPLALVKAKHGRLKDAGAAGLPEFGGALLNIRIVDLATGKEALPGAYGEIGAAFVDMDGDASEEALRRFCEENLASFQIPRHFFFSKRADWPATASGKVQKFKLRQIAEERLRALSAQKPEEQEGGHASH